jgi:uncharacterized protein YndB with AHSA1/START domain
MISTELTRVDRAIEIRATPERVWRALTSRDELSAWFRVAIDGEIAAGREVWMTSTDPNYPGHRFKVRFTELTPGKRLVWQWHPGEVDPKVDYSREPETTVTIELEPTPEGTRVTVAETGFDRISLERRAKVYRDNEQGWAEVLVWLQRHAEASH